ncbi:MAG: hypothetical protein AVDCRST_MAG68-1546, partial [uncultured Gemmatimonadetes bacterium]
ALRPDLGHPRQPAGAEGGAGGCGRPPRRRDLSPGRRGGIRAVAQRNGGAPARVGRAGDRGELRQHRGGGSRALRVQVRGPAPGSARPPLVRVDARPRLPRNEALPGVAPLPHGLAAARRARAGAQSGARARHPHAQHALLDRGPRRRVLPEDGRARGRPAGRRRLLRPHPQAVAPRGGGHPLPQHRLRRPSQRRRLARRIRAARHGRRAVRPVHPRGVRPGGGDGGDSPQRTPGRLRRVPGGGRQI